MKHYGIRKQTLLVAVLPILVMAVLLENYLVYSRFADLDSAFLERSQMLVRQLASSSEYGVFSGNVALLQQDTNAALRQQDVSRVLVLDASANPLIGEAGGGRGQNETLLVKANSSTPVYQDEDVLILYEPIVSTHIELNDLDIESGLMPASAKRLGAVIIEVSKIRLTGQKHEIFLLSLVITLMTLITALILAFWASRRITLPIMGMSQAIRSYGEGNLDTRVLPQSKILELNELSMGFNEMAKKLQQHQVLLESRVAERTLALAASEHDSRTLIENSPDFIARYNRDLHLIYANPAFCSMTEGECGAMVGKKPSESSGGPNAEIYEAKIKEVFETGEDVHFELKWTGKFGKEIHNEVRLTAERDLTGTIISVLCVGHDITELNESKEELNRKELAKSRFLAAAGHDLRQPLTAANLFIDALKFTELSADQKQIIDRLDRAMSIFNELLEALLNISKLDAGIIKPEYSRIDLSEIINWLDQCYAAVANKKQLGFKLHLAMKEPLVIYSDINLIKSVLMNLVSNAIKYTSKGGVMVCVRRRGGEVLFQVWDSGIGIKEEYIEQIFDEFYQIDNPQRDRTSGLGLGLAISKRAISLLGGKITCRSRIDQGSVFEFRLPLPKSQSEAVSQSVLEFVFENVDHESFARGKHFVVVEDDALVGEGMHKVLTTMGGEVQCFKNAEDALLNANLEQDNCFIVDYMLGGDLNGIQFLNHIRKKLGKPIRAVLMTGDTSFSFIRETDDCAWPVLHKPANISKLIATLTTQT